MSSSAPCAVDELWLPATVGAYLIGILVRRRWSWPVLQPTLIAMAVLGAGLVATRVPYAHYVAVTSPLSAFLGPAIVALAVPLHRERETLVRHARPLLLGALLGAASAILVGWLAGRLLHLTPAWSLALTSRSATSPISIALAGELHGTAALSAVLSILSGVVGAVVGPAWLTLVRVHHPLARGLAHGVTSHGIGTARMLEESGLAGATATVGMALGGLIVALALPLVWT
ncbi:MAG: LrgB family protein [Conexibacter sp.]|nr:LrgB family protein [Conexibacter sp.]